MQRKLHSVEDCIFWSYSVLTATRIIMKCNATGRPNPYSTGRTKAANITMSKYQNKTMNIRNLDRDDALAQLSKPICAHCGKENSNYHLDHLIPKSKIKNMYIGLNQVVSCPKCNVSRGDKDLMKWYRQNDRFPTLGVLRRYLKICYFHAEQKNFLHLSVEKSMGRGIPFDPSALPQKFPPITQIVWDYAHPDG